MQFQGIGRDEHSAQAHHVTKCMHDHSHYKMESESSRGASPVPKAQEVQAAQAQGEGQMSLSAWLDRYLSKGKGLLRSIWGGGEIMPGEAGGTAGQAQTEDGLRTQATVTRSNAADPLQMQSASTLSAEQASQTVSPAMAAQAAAAVPNSAPEPSHVTAAQAVGAQEEGLWRRVKVRFKDIAGQLAGHLRGKAFTPRKKSFFQMEQEPRKEEPRKTARAKKDALEIDSYRVEESYLLDSYDRKGGYSRLSTKK